MTTKELYELIQDLEDRGAINLKRTCSIQELVDLIDYVKELAYEEYYETAYARGYKVGCFVTKVQEKK